MATHAISTFGIYSNPAQIDGALSLLRRLGFGDSPTAVLMPTSDGAKDFPQVQKSELVKFGKIGSIAGAVLFFIFGNLAASGIVSIEALSSESVVIRVLFIFGSAFVGAVIGATCGTLVGIGTPDRAGRRYGQYVQSGGILLSVHSDTHEQQKVIEEALERSGAHDITSVNEEAAWRDVLAETENIERVILPQTKSQISLSAKEHQTDF